MKKSLLTLGAALTACLFMGQGVQAKTLEQILKEKGVITEAEFKEATAEAAKEAAKSKPFDYTLGKGFTFTSADEKFQLTLGGRMQFRYTFMDYDDDFGKKDYSQFNAQRIRIILQGYAYSKDLTYKMEVDPRVLAQSSGQYGGLLDCFLSYKFMDEVQLLLGQTKTQFGRQEINSDGALMFVDRSPVVNSLKHGYDLGVMLYGKVAKGLLNYSLAWSGGAGQTTGRSTNSNMLSTRVAFNPLGDMSYDEPDFARSDKPLLSIGTNYFRNTLKKTAAATATTTGLEVTVPNYAASSGWLGKNLTNNNTFSVLGDKVTVDTYGFDIAFRWKGLSAQAEYLLAEAENNGSYTRIMRAHGYYGQIGYMILPELGVAFRYSYLDPNRDVANDLVTEQIGSISYYFNKHNLKLQADIGNIHTQSGKNYVPYGTFSAIKVPTDDMQYRLQAQIIF